MKQHVNHSAGEREAVRTTIVGGRPPGSGRDNGSIPRGIEILVKKAAVDREFRATLIEQRADAANTIGLELTASEAAMMKTIPERQLLSIISHTDVPDQERRVFLGRAAAAMLAVLGAGVASSCGPPATTGIAPDMPERIPASDGIRPDVPAEAESRPAVSTGVRPEAPKTKGIRPDVPRNVPAPTGIRPDVPQQPQVEVVAGVRVSPPTNKPPAKPKAEQPKTKKPKADPPPPPPKSLQVSRGVRPDIPRKAGE